MFNETCWKTKEIFGMFRKSMMKISTKTLEWWKWYWLTVYHISMAMKNLWESCTVIAKVTMSYGCTNQIFSDPAGSSHALGKDFEVKYPYISKRIRIVYKTLLTAFSSILYYRDFVIKCCPTFCMNNFVIFLHFLSCKHNSSWF